MFYVVRNASTYHLTGSLDPEGTALCGSRYQAHTASVVHEQPSPEHFTACKRCEAKVGERG